MNKALAVAVLLIGAFVLGFATNNTGVSDDHFREPHVIAKVDLTNQTAGIPTTTIFTPTHTGLYRLSNAMTMSTPVPNSNGQWTLFLNWTDEGGMETAFLAQLSDSATPPQDYPTPGLGENPIIFKALAGTPVSYQVFSDFGAGTYAISFVVERID
jgi:hypothetical protein